MSMKTVFSVLLLCILMATPIAAEYDAWSVNSGPWMCYPGQAFQVPALPGCHPVLKLQCNGSKVPEAVLRDCCQQLATSASGAGAVPSTACWTACIRSMACRRDRRGQERSHAAGGRW
uniref:Bifunctional inhibitor/plant lipid transfer protein/seed storage helical domain-containing protein n=1 Tax=Triticum urartu TaxID=4572 RepID=A0A8R7TRR6_TRIUA